LQPFRDLARVIGLLKYALLATDMNFVNRVRMLQEGFYLAISNGELGYMELAHGDNK